MAKNYFSDTFQWNYTPMKQEPDIFEIDTCWSNPANSEIFSTKKTQRPELLNLSQVEPIPINNNNTDDDDDDDNYPYQASFLFGNNEKGSGNNAYPNKPSRTTSEDEIFSWLKEFDILKNLTASEGNSKQFLTSQLDQKPEVTNNNINVNNNRNNEYSYITNIENDRVSPQVTAPSSVDSVLSNDWLKPSTNLATMPVGFYYEKDQPKVRGRKPSILPDDSKQYFCHLCKKRFKRHEHLKRHFRTIHLRVRPFECSVCHKRFSRNDNLNQHVRIHEQQPIMEPIRKRSSV
ncbi:hypothetical protein NCAS_0C04070 [Naumovozyma castellii]|uniref:C2H2-type domain-containing protein n=1 Tax=Naumovozyma castellii TaxID=27288 RepID=G0VD35_NAUCA|nr:hypothetical protein NCAS_0C04070 [Naumovozyma castellii CBS 4309]CCC69397.1 hypothetical protein NCAS_0C04070 [Naumovozyma castellii CBS 4309]